MDVADPVDGSGVWGVLIRVGDDIVGFGGSSSSSQWRA